MVYCRYCGEKNEDGTLKCIKCGKPLSLLPVDYPENVKGYKPDHINKKSFNEDLRNDYQNNRGISNQKSIKSRYIDFNQYDNNFDKNEHGNNQTNRLNNLPNSQTDYYGANYRKHVKTHGKNYVEWDVVVATALLVVILATILQRFFPRIGLFITLFIGLIYILVATKSKSTLIKSIPLAIIMAAAISAYFSL